MKTLLSVVITLTVLFSACGGDGLPPTGDVYSGGAPSADGEKKTDKQVRVRAKSGSVKEEWFPHIDAGLDKAFAIAKAEPNNYSGFSEHPNFVVATWGRSPRCTNPAFLVNADGSPHYSTGQGWDNHPTYDKDPREGYTLLCVAGLTQYTTGYGGQSGGQYGMVIVDDIGLMKTIVWYEAEHEILFQADHAKWLATKGVHAHPLLGEGDSLAAFNQIPNLTATIIDFNSDSDTLFDSSHRTCVLLTN